MPKHDTQDLLDFIHRRAKNQMYVDAKGYWLDISTAVSREEYVNLSKWPRKKLLDFARSVFGYRG